MKEQLEKEKVVKVEKKMGQVTDCVSVFLRVEPDLTKGIHTALPVGSIVEIESLKDGWYHVHTEMGVEGYIQECYVKEM